MKMPLTTKQDAIYRFIEKYIEENHMPPSLREIGAQFGLSVGTVQDQVEALRRKGYLNKEETRARGLRLPMDARQVPVLGRVHAGPLHAAIENVEGYLPVGTSMSPSQHFALKVRGDSMVDAGILEGDLVVVRVQATANDGDIVVARVDDDATVKRLRRKGHRTVLEPANSRYRSLEGEFALLGVVVEVRRQYRR